MLLLIPIFNQLKNSLIFLFFVLLYVMLLPIFKDCLVQKSCRKLLLSTQGIYFPWVSAFKYKLCQALIFCLCSFFLHCTWLECCKLARLGNLASRVVNLPHANGQLAMDLPDQKCDEPIHTDFAV